MSAGGISTGDVAMMLEKVHSDSSIPAVVRNRAWRESPALDRPERVLRRLQALAQEVLPGIPRDPPVEGLSRVVSAHTFFRHHTRPDVRELFLTSEDFVRYVASSDDPSAVVRNVIAQDAIIFAWQRSWLTPTLQITGLNGRELITSLELGDSAEPPFVAFHLPYRLMIAAGVMVRRPCALDSVLGPNPQWSPRGLASGIKEFVDGDVPLAAIDGMEWVP